MRIRSIFAIFTLIASLNVALIPSANAANVTFSQTFTQSAVPGSSVVSAWETFRSRLTGSYNSFTWSNNLGATTTVSDATKIQTLANALRAGTATSVSIGAATWYVGVGCGGTAGYSTAVEFSNQGTCSCTSGYNIRPLINNSNWGGSNGTTCGAVTQTITITFFDSSPDITPPTITSTNSFNAAENQTTVGTATANESVTWTKVGGVDSLTVTINLNTGVIIFVSARDYEIPSDANKNNIYEVTIRATDTAGNTTDQSITITVTDVVDTSSFNSFALAGGVTSATFRGTIQINASVTVASKVTFKAANIVIAGCKGKLATGSGSTYTVSCSWKPSKRGGITLTATSSPTNVAIEGATAAPISVAVVNRTGPR